MKKILSISQLQSSNTSFTEIPVFCKNRIINTFLVPFTNREIGVVYEVKRNIKEDCYGLLRLIHDPALTKKIYNLNDSTEEIVNKFLGDNYSGKDILYTAKFSFANYDAVYLYALKNLHKPTKMPVLYQNIANILPDKGKLVCGKPALLPELQVAIRQKPVIHKLVI